MIPGLARDAQRLVTEDTTPTTPHRVHPSRYISEYSRAMDDGTAAVFVGAGLSRPAGFVDWRGLLRPVARSIGIDVDVEDDLVSVAQYITNESGQNRTRLL